MFRKTAVSIVALALAACGQKSTPQAGATLEGNVQGAAALTVSAASKSTQTDSLGHFALIDVPEGTREVHFSGSGVDASLQISALSRREHRSISVSVSGHDAAEHPEQGEQELHGVIDTVAAPSFTLVGGKAVNTTTATTFSKNGAAIAFADLNSGDAVEAEGAIQSDGSLLARSVKIEAAENENENENEAEQDEDVHFQGALNAMNGSSLTVGTTSVTTDANTRIEGTLALNEQVSVEGLLQQDGSVLAKEIKALSEDEQAEASVAGAVTAIADDGKSFQIGSSSIAVDASTQFSGQGSFASIADLHVGDMVDVEAARQADGSLLAKKVERLDQPELNEIEVQGPITAIDASSLTVQGKQFFVDSSTEIRKSGDAVQFSSLQMNQNAEVRGVTGSDGKLHATRISL